MSADFPAITSFGTLLKYAQALEEHLAAIAGRAAERAGGAGRGGLEIRAGTPAGLAACAKMHARRAQQLERLRRERLNEVVLQPVAGMDRTTYLPEMELPVAGEGASAGDETLAALAASEERASRFYRDAAACATHVLGGLERSFGRMAAESAEMAVALRGR